MLLLALPLILWTTLAGGQAPPTPAPQSPPAPIRVGDAIRRPTKFKHVHPVYPAIAMMEGVQGILIVEVTIAPTGKVDDARILRSIPLLDAAALEAVRQWEYLPTLLNGVPVPLIMAVEIEFTLNVLIALPCSEESTLASRPSSTATSIQFLNPSSATRKVYRLTSTGQRQFLTTLLPNGTSLQATSVGDRWVVTNDQDACVAIYLPDDSAGLAILR